MLKMNRCPLRLQLRVLIVVLVLATGGCRAIRQFGESRQSIAARRLSRQGLKAMHEGQWEIAETLFTNALDVSKADDRAHWGLAESLWQRGERTSAIAHMEQAVRLSAGDPKLVQRLGRMYLDVGRLEEADRQSVAALEADRNSATVWALRGDCLAARGRREKALAAYHRALALQPDFPTAQLEAADIYRHQGRYDRLLATLDRLQDDMGQKETPARADMLRGIAMRELGRPGEARRCFVRAAGKDPDDASPYLQLATLSLDGGDVAAAQQSLLKAMEVDSESVVDVELIARLREQQRQQDRQRRMASESAGPLSPGEAQRR